MLRSGAARATVLLVALLAVLPGVPTGATGATGATPGPRGDWTWAWGGTFADGVLPPGCGPYQGMPGAGGAAWSAEQVEVRDGAVRIDLERRTTSGRRWTSGGIGCLSRIQTHGRYEIRARVPAGDGLETVLVLWAGEGDRRARTSVVLSGGSPERITVTDGDGTRSAGRTLRGLFSDAQHTYVLQWRPGGTSVEVDGNVVWTSTRSFDGPRWLGILLRTTGKGPAPDAPLPATLVVDALAVYRYTPGRGGTGGLVPPPPPPTPTAGASPSPSGSPSGTATPSPTVTATGGSRATRPPAPPTAALLPADGSSAPIWPWALAGVLAGAAVVAGTARAALRRPGG